MYTVSKGPSKLVAKTRRGISQNLERLETLRDIRKPAVDDGDGEVVSIPKPVFNLVNGKKSNPMRTQQETISPQHEEIIKFIYDSWTSVCKEGDQDSMEPSQKDCKRFTVLFKFSDFTYLYVHDSI
ncbi:hypothetical protein AAG570_013742 [Ranatra chinensis]|uniref:MAPK regulated corepressor interacting protein 2 n=1 Tax=Ranatra chinensis TaxID=642074 RepID=A0ABD0YD87_9HEMI